jgi:hypothetical protein
LSGEDDDAERDEEREGKKTGHVPASITTKDTVLIRFACAHGTICRSLRLGGADHRSRTCRDVPGTLGWAGASGRRRD